MRKFKWSARHPKWRVQKLCLAAALSVGVGAFITATTVEPANGASSELSDTTVAIVDGAQITGEEYANFLRFYLRSKLYHGGSRERIRELAQEALDTMIEKKLLASAAQRRGLKGDPSEVEARIDEIRRRYGERAEWPAIEAQLPAIRSDILADTQIEELRARISTVPKPTERDLRAFHAENPTLFTEPPSWDIDLILLGVPPSSTALEWAEARKKALTITAEIKAGRPFSEAAKEYSSHDTAQNGGRITRVHRGQLPAEAEAELDKIAMGELSDPIRVLEGYAILRLNGTKPAKLHPFEEVRDRVVSLYERERSKSQWAGFLADLRKQSSVKTYDISGLIDRVVANK